MAQVINDEIFAAWRALSGDGSGDGWRCISISGSLGPHLMAARHFPDNAEALLVGFDNVILPLPGALPSGSGFRVEHVNTGRPGNWLALVRQPSGSLDLFARMTADVVETLTATGTVTENRILQLLIGRIRAWQHFMSRTGGALGPEAELGLAGELECAAHLIAAGMSAYAVMDGWKGPLDGLQDFELGNGAIEVKSTLAQTGFPATILSLEQLDDAVRQPLFLCGCRFMLGPGGNTLPQRVATMREMIAKDSAALALFETGLIHVGFVDADAKFYTRSFVSGPGRFILVNNAFPRLTPGTVPHGIRHARYEIDLDAIDCPQASVEDVIGMIGDL
ncbi:MAG: PD-(D/E)XK motif protein [Burkholderiaceae bacterium]|nr:PD-(D/E)XK motif protein [Burkholderiaceae bacterium]